MCGRMQEVRANVGRHRGGNFYLYWIGSAWVFYPQKTQRIEWNMVKRLGDYGERIG